MNAEKDAPRCWRSECRNGCYYPDVCSERPTRYHMRAHTLNEYGTTDCPVERVRAFADDGECSACGGRVFPPAVTDGGAA